MRFSTAFVIIQPRLTPRSQDSVGCLTPRSLDSIVCKLVCLLCNNNIRTLHVRRPQTLSRWQQQFWSVTNLSVVMISKVLMILNFRSSMIFQPVENYLFVMWKVANRAEVVYARTTIFPSPHQPQRSLIDFLIRVCACWPNVSKYWSRRGPCRSSPYWKLIWKLTESVYFPCNILEHC